MVALGLIASIIGVTGVGAKLAISFYEIADSISSADHEIGRIAAEVSSFAHVLSAVSKSPETETFPARQSGLVAKKIVEQCEEIFGELSNLLKPLQYFVSDGLAKQRLRIHQRVR